MKKWLKKIFRRNKDKIKKKISKALDSEVLRIKIEETLREKFIKKANEKINLPILDERQEAVLIGLAYDLIIGIIKKQIGK